MHKKLQEILEEDPRYELAAYRFVLEALNFTQERMSQNIRHISGQELLEGIKEFGLLSFGPLAGAVFRCWGVRSTMDFGHIVFNLVDKELMGKEEADTLDDFEDGFQLEDVFWNEYQDAPLFQN